MDAVFGGPFGPSGLFASVQPGATGQGGTLTLATGRLTLLDGAQVGVSTAGVGNGGTLQVQATDVELQGTAFGEFPSSLQVNVLMGATGNGGSLTLTTETLSLTDGAQIQADTVAAGNAGTVQINAETIMATGTAPAGFPSGVFSVVEAGAAGNGGSLSLNVDRLLLTNGAQVSSSTLGAGDAGLFTLQARQIEVMGTGETLPSAILATVEPGAMGNGGNIQIQTDLLRLTEGGQIATSTSGDGNAGDLTAIAQTIELVGTSPVGSSGLLSNAVNDGTGAGGDLLVQANHISLREGATLTVSNFPSNPNLDVLPGQGPAGNITLTTGSLQVETGSTISADANAGGAGNIEIVAAAPETLLLDQGAITTAGGEGNISIATPLLLLRRNSLISAQASETSNGGNVDIDGTLVVAFPTENSDILANAAAGQGGNINITTEGLFGLEVTTDALDLNLSEINASSETGIDGVVEINTPEVDPNQGLVDLPTQAEVPTVLQGCAASGEAPDSQFVDTGRGGVRPSPTEPLSNHEIWEDVQLPAPPTQTSTESEGDLGSPPAQIVEAQGWQVDAQGNTVLVANVSAKPRECVSR